MHCDTLDRRLGASSAPGRGPTLPMQGHGRQTLDVRPATGDVRARSWPDAIVSGTPAGLELDLWIVAFAIARLKRAREQKQSCRAQAAHVWIDANAEASSANRA
jgi:hypothetical protein